MEQVNINETILEEMKKMDEKTGRFNILIGGPTGVGKSTLINSVFQGNLAETGQGVPVTQETREYTKEGIPLSIIDTKGIETADFARTFGDLEKYVKERHQETDVNRQIHCAWVCLSEDSRRIQDSDKRFAKMLSDYMPVIAVITKARADNGFSDKVREELPWVKNVVRVRAIAETFDEGTTIPPMGLDKLIDATMEVIPEGVRNAFAASQKASLRQKKDRAQKIIAGAATAAAAAGVVPIPFSDSAVLIPIEIGMLAGISKVFGLEPSKSLLGTLVSSMLGTTAATVAGRAIVTGLLKLVPGINVLASAVSGATAATLTTTLGEVYMGTLTALYKVDSDGKQPDPEEIKEVFDKKLKERK